MSKWGDATLMALLLVGCYGENPESVQDVNPSGWLNGVTGLVFSMSINSELLAYTRINQSYF